MKRSPAFRSKPGAGILPTRIFGPCRSASTATATPCAAAPWRIASKLCVWSSCDPCDMLSRATFIPAPINALIISGSLLAGPRVHTILARRS